MGSKTWADEGIGPYKVRRKIEDSGQTEPSARFSDVT